MKIFALILLLIGAFVTYGANFVLEKILKKESGEKEVAVTKLVGLLIALAGAIIIFVL